MYIFVGEGRSARAMGVTWRDGRLAAKPLLVALRECGLEPEEQKFVSLWAEGGELRDHLLDVLRYAGPAYSVVALGQRVHQELERQGIPHLALTHPAARGKIRACDAYRARVRAVLKGE